MYKQLFLLTIHLFNITYQQLPFYLMTNCQLNQYYAEICTHPPNTFASFKMHGFFIEVMLMNWSA